MRQNRFVIGGTCETVRPPTTTHNPTIQRTHNPAIQRAHSVIHGIRARTCQLRDRRPRRLRGRQVGVGGCWMCGCYGALSRQYGNGAMNMLAARPSPR